MNKYWLTFKLSWQSFLEYRFNLVLQLAGSIVFYVSTAILWIAIFHNRTSIGGFTESEMVTYILGSGIIGGYIFYVSIGDIIDQWIRRGVLSGWLTRPLNIPNYWFFDDLARRFFNIFLSGLGFVIVVLFFHQYLIFQDQFVFWFYAIIIMILAGILNYLIFYLIGIFAFWMEETWGMRFLLRTFLWIAGGSIIPLSLLPGIIGKIIMFLPFKYTFFVPMQIYLGKVAVDSIHLIILGECVWIFVLWFSGKLVWNLGIKHYTAVGG